ncbi:MAG TPA: SCO family protein [Thermoanaerobaculia bacterium]|nr:SCO family protein [Thermoanaerobaculia bacterium]
MSGRAPGIALAALLFAGSLAAQPAQPAQPAMSPISSAAREGGVASTVVPTPLKNVGYDQRLGAQVPLDLSFRDEAGRAVRLGELFDPHDHRPVVFALAYYGCPMLCSVVLSDLAASLKVLSFDAGRQFDVLVVSFDPRDTPPLAAAKKREMVARYGHPGAAAGIHYLTGSEESIAALTKAVGFRYYFDRETRQFAHAAGVLVLTPGGRVARYLYGIEYPARDLRLALVEASGDRIGSPVDQLLLYCFHYNPVIGRYSAVTLNLVRLGGAATVLGLFVMVVTLKRRESRGPGRA